MEEMGTMTEMLPLSFPKLRSVLWDQTWLSEDILIGPSVCVPHSLSMRTAVLKSLLERGGNKTSLVFGKQVRARCRRASGLGGDYALHFDGFDLGNGASLPQPTEASLGIRQQKQHGSSSPPFHIKSMTDATMAVENALESWFSVKARRFRVTSLVKFYGFTSRIKQQGIVFTIEAYVPSIHLVFHRVHALPLLSTPLLKRLQHSNTEEEEDGFQYGLITLNETRRAVLLLEDDPLACKVPVVGVWFKRREEAGGGAKEDLNHVLRMAVQDPAVYCGCVRYAANEHLSERVSPVDTPKTMLVCLLGYASTPLFAECTMSSLDEARILDLFVCSLEFDFAKDREQAVEAPFALPVDVQDRMDFQTLVRASVKPALFKTDWIKPVKLAPEASTAAAVVATVQQINREETLRRQAEEWFEREHAKELSKPLIDANREVGAMTHVDFIAKQREEIARIQQLLSELGQVERSTPPSPPPPPPPVTSLFSSHNNMDVNEEEDATFEDDEEILAIEKKYAS